MARSALKEEVREGVGSVLCRFVKGVEVVRWLGRGVERIEMCFGIPSVRHLLCSSICWLLGDDGYMTARYWLLDV